MSPKTNSQLEAELQEAQARIAHLEQALTEEQDSPSRTQAEIDERFRWLLELLPVGVSILNAENKVVFSNHVLQDILQLTEEGLASGSYQNRRYLAADGSPMPADGFASARAARSGQPVYNVDTGIIKENGETIWTSVSAVPVNFADWKTVILSSDITQRKRAEEALKQSEAKYSALFEKSAVPAALTNMPEGTFADVNKAFQAAFGYSREEILGKTSLEIGIARPEERAETQASLERYGTTRDNEKHLFTKSGELRIGAINASKIMIDGRDFVITTIHDMTERKRAEAKLVESEARFVTIFENSPIAMEISDLSTGKITEANAAFLHLYGYTRAEVIGRTTAELEIWVTPADGQHFIDQLLTEGSVRNLELVARLKSGDKRSVLVSGERVEINGRASLLAQIQDITERKQAEQQLSESRELFRMLFDLSPVAYSLVKASDHRIVDANPACENLFGYSKTEILGKRTVDLDYWVDEKELRRATEEFTRHGKLRNFEFAYKTKSGATGWAISYANLIEQGGEKYFLSEFVDITQRKRAEQELDRSQENFSRAFHSNPAALAITRVTDGKFLLVNEAYTSFMGYEPVEIIGRTVQDLKIYVNQWERDELINQVRQKGRVRGRELLVRNKSGNVRSLMVSIEPVQYNDESCILSTFLDITERKLMEIRLAENERQYRELVQNANSAIIRWKRDGRITFFNEFAQAFFGYPSEAVIGRPISMLVPAVDSTGGDLSMLVQNIVEHPEQFINVINENICRDGRRVWMAWTNKPVYDEKGRLSEILAVGVDITERRRAEEELHTSKRLLQDIIDNTSALVYILDTDGRFLLVNRRLQELFGPSSAEIVGRSRSDFMPAESARQHRENDIEIFRTEKGRTFEEENIEPDGRHVYLTTKFPLINQHGSVYAVCGISTDMTARKLMEEELHRSNTELEQFAYIASHDLQEPLRALTGMVQLLQRRYQGKLDERADEYISHAVEAASRMQALIQALLAYSRVDRRSKPMEQVDAGECLRTALMNLDVFIHESQAVITADELPVVYADPTQLVQLFQNLVGNGIKFRGEREPQIHISVSKLKDAWQFSAHDNGIGIEPQYFERIFLIFQRLHSRGEYPGTGIGLALCKKIVERHGGSIGVESIPGEGSTFFFTLPVRRNTDDEHNSQAH